MSKKEVRYTSKPTARQADPEDVAADAWVAKRQLPNDNLLVEPEREVKAEKIVRMTFDLSRDLHRRFRTTCSQMDRNMTDELRAFVVRFLAENEGRQS